MNKYILRKIDDLAQKIGHNGSDFYLSKTNFIKREILAQVISCEFCINSKNSFFYRAPPVATSDTVFLVFIESPLHYSRKLRCNYHLVPSLS